MIELWGALKEALAGTLNFFYVYVPPYNYGVAIILLTLIVRVVLLPLTIKQTRSMYEMQRLQPKLKALQQKYKDDKQKLNEEVMKFYGENKVNPLGGCLPLVLQLPIMIALFRVLYEAKGLGTTPFLWMNLAKTPGSMKLTSAPDILAAVPYLVMVGLMMWTTYAQSKMMSQDPQQQRMMLFMALFMAFVGWQFPAGVLLYWVVTNLWTIGQQYLTLKTHHVEPAPATAAIPTPSAALPGGESKKPKKSKKSKKSRK